MGAGGGVKIPVRWMDVEDIQSPKDDLDTHGFDEGATTR